jgi:ABC-2 type transport system permease protein
MRIFGLNRRIIRVLLGSQYAHMLEYRAEIALWALSGVLPFIMLSVWSGSEARTGLGLDGVALDRYFLSAYLVRQFTVVWVVYAFEEDALLGRLSPYLLQPLHPLWRYVAAHLGEQLTRLPFAALIAAGVLCGAAPGVLDPFSGSVPAGLAGHLGWPLPLPSCFRA